jgi:predicted nuclease with RNAse H fold
MLRPTYRTHSINKNGFVAVGIDVGGKRKGYHAVAIRSGKYFASLSTKDVVELTLWCVESLRAKVIAVDAPCHWSIDGHARPAEIELMRKGIWCFATPTQDRAIHHPTNQYGWMLQGEALFQALMKTYLLCSSLPPSDHNCCFETFPHAIAWHLTNGQADTSGKREQRRALLKQASIDLSALTNIDLIDAALCALTAYHAASGGKCVSYGEPKTGLIIIPEGLNL